MRIVLLITVLEGLVLTFWLVMRRHYQGLPTIARAIRLQRLPIEAAEFAGRLRYATRWAFINEWQLEGQSDDRSPMHNPVVESDGSPASRRSRSRRSHQLQYKKWSTERHE